MAQRARYILVFGILAALSVRGGWTFAGGNSKTTAKPLDPAAVKFFETNVRPVFANRCFECHGPKKQRGDLRLDSLAGLLEGGKSGPAIKPGNPEQSLLISAIRHGDIVQMPPKQKLPAKEIADLTAWVKMGAPWPDAKPAVKQAPTPDGEPAFTAEQKNFWAFISPKKPDAPKVKNAAWVQMPIDAFILAKLEEKGLSPAPPADPRTLLRRMYFDLIGLPPTPAEVEEFVRDCEARSAKRGAHPGLALGAPRSALERVVDRLLASPRYGERWGRHWLDVARYADSNGMDENLVYGNAWRYRDYVIKAFNEDKPYDQFIRQQIAGDLLDVRPLAPRGADPLDSRPLAPRGAGPSRSEGPTLDRITATGFLVMGPKMLAEDDPVKMEMDIIDEQVDTIGRTFMGLTLGCARCHDHKYDPIPTSDYYGLAGIFKSTKTMDNFRVVARWHERPAGTKEDVAKLQAHEALIAEASAKLDEALKKANERLVTQERRKLAKYAEAVELLRQHAELEKNLRPAMATGTPPRGALVVEAENFSRGNVLKSFDGYGEKIGVIYNKGPLPNYAEYDLTIPKDGIYQLELRYAAAESRPVEVYLDGQRVRIAAAGKVTGSWHPDTQTWHVEGLFALKAGKNTLRLERAQPFPHFDKLALAPMASKVLPRTLEQLAADWKLLTEFLLAWQKALEGLPALTPDALSKLAEDPKGPFAAGNLESHFSAEEKAAVNKLRDAVTKFKKNAPELPEVMAVSDQKPVNLRVHVRGNHLTLGKEVARRFPRILGQTPLNNKSSGRLELANWLTRPEHPLTSRVMVNRLWHWHFGAGLVRSTDNFGLLGERPTNQALLDWLAVRFIDSGWSIKAMHRMIMLSSTYQMSTSHDESAAQVDPENRLHWRMNRKRLEAEAIRDALLFISGALDLKMGGSVFEGKNRVYVPGYPNANYEKYDFPRRSVYLPVVRSMLYDVFQAFDFADPSVANGERPSTTVAPQALFMMNGKLVEDNTRALANKLLKQTKLDDPSRIRQLYKKVYSRPPTEKEINRALDFVGRLEREYKEGAAADRRLRAWQSLCRVLVAANEFVYVE